MPGARHHQGHPGARGRPLSLERLGQDQSHTVAAGHTGRIARGRWLAEMALRAFAEDWREQPGGQSGDG